MAASKKTANQNQSDQGGFEVLCNGYAGGSSSPSYIIVLSWGFQYTVSVAQSTAKVHMMWIGLVI
jgi:hypothetical protein